MGLFEALENALINLLTIKVNAGLIIFFQGSIIIFKSAVFAWALYRALLILRGENDGIYDFIKKLVLLVLISFIADPSTAEFISFRAALDSFINDLPAALTGVSSVSAALDGLLDSFSSFTSDSLDTVGGAIDTTVWILQIGLMFIFFAFALVTTFITLIVYKIYFLILIMIAPLFILCAGFGNTKAYFFNWLNTILSAIFTVVFLAVVLSFLLSILDGLFDKLLLEQDGGRELKFSGVFFFVISSMVFYMIAQKISSLASSIFGANSGADGVTSSFMNTTSNASKDGIQKGVNASKTGTKNSVAVAKYGKNKIKSGKIKKG